VHFGRDAHCSANQLAGMDKMQKSMTTYVKSLSKRAEGDDREKQLPGGHLGSSMVTHGEDFEPDSEFGNCLSCMPSTQRRLSTYLLRQLLVAPTSDWLVYRRHTFPVPPTPGSRALSAPSSK
jgi:hypothetical protein